MERLSEVSTECLEHEITVLATQMAAATCRWLLLVAEFDRRETWAGWGCRSGAHWLAWQCGLELCTAREHVRVARALEELPRTTAAFGEGRVTYSKVRAYRSAAVDDLDAVNARHAARFVSWSWDDDGSLVLTARLSPEDGAAVVEAIEGTADRLRSHEWNDASADASLRRNAGQRRGASARNDIRTAPTSPSISNSPSTACSESCNPRAAPADVEARR